MLSFLSRLLGGEAPDLDLLRGYTFLSRLLGGEGVIR